MPTSRETLADLIELHFADLAEVGRSKEATHPRLKDTVGGTHVPNITRDMLVQLAKRRAKEGTGTVMIVAVRTGLRLG